ncbi:MAG: hypothetical protein E7426_03415 [Ruminococcaceae bacterium]|nr:hypothetical protein [Oscillospiraceae bacterium]
MGLFSCSYLKSEGMVFISYSCKADKEDLETYTVQKICQTSEYVNCNTYKKASRLFCIATAATDALGRSRTCEELHRLIGFRKNYLEKELSGQLFLQEYDVTGPQIVEAINARRDAKEVYRRIDRDYLEPCLQLLDRGDNAGCFALYRDMFTALRGEYLPEEV